MYNLKKSIVLVFCLVIILVLVACQPTPSKQIVVDKNDQENEIPLQHSKLKLKRIMKLNRKRLGINNMLMKKVYLT